MNSTAWRQSGRKGKMMSRDEFLKIADAIKTYYPSEKLLPNKAALELWYQELKDLPYGVANAALRRHVNTSPFPPAIADLRKGAAGMQKEPGSWSSGWEQFQAAVRKFGFYQQEDALNSMDGITRKVVRRLGWKELCMSENLMQDRANFRMIYEQEEKQDGEWAALPGNLQAQIKRLQEDGSAPRIGGAGTGGNDEG